MDSESDIDGKLTGGSNCGFESIEESFSTSSPVNVTDCPSSVDIDTRGGSSTALKEGAAKDRVSGIVDVVEMIEFRFDDIVRAGDIERCKDPDPDPCVLVLNREGSGGLSEIVLFLLSPPLTLDARSIILCRAVRSTFFSAKGKYSVRCVVMSSLGGR
jgi:hypothetical protein